MNIESWLLFSSIALVATITPGPAVLLVSTHSISFGPNRAIFTIMGNICGLFTLSLLSVLGLGAIVLYSATAFTAVKLIGSAYLIYLGVKLWREGFSTVKPTDASSSCKNTNPVTLFIQGLLVALSNPKAIAFTTALFPQFIDKTSPLLPQFSILVFSFMAYSFICLYIYGRISSSTSARTQNSKIGRIVSRIFSGLFIGSGIGLGASS